MSNTVILTIAGGFYFYGTQVESPQEGYLALKNYAMFGGFAGGKGLPGVARGDVQATVILDCFEKDTIGYFPISACYGILPCIDLYKFKGATLR